MLIIFEKMDIPTPITDAAYFRPGATMYSLAGEMKKLERQLACAISYSKLSRVLLDAQEVRHKKDIEELTRQRDTLLTALKIAADCVRNGWPPDDLQMAVILEAVRRYTPKQEPTPQEISDCHCEDCHKPIPVGWDYPHCPQCLQIRLGTWDKNKGAERQAVS